MTQSELCDGTTVKDRPSKGFLKNKESGRRAGVIEMPHIILSRMRLALEQREFVWCPG